MIQLETTFVSGEGGFSQDPLTYTQLIRTDKVAIYERSRDGKVKDYEVFFVKVDPKGKKIFNTVLEDDREKYPSNEQFGRIAWSFSSKGGALQRYEELCKKAETPAEEEESVKELLFPVGEFSTTELAEFNKVPYPNASIFVKTSLEAGTIKFVKEERRNIKGKATKLYAKA